MRPLNRTSFLTKIIIVVIIFLAVNYLRISYVPLSHSGIYLASRFTVEFMFLVSISPFIVGRLSDLELKPIWVLFPFITLIFKPTSMLIIQQFLNFKLSEFDTVIIAIYLVEFLMSIYLFLAKGKNKLAC